MGIKLKTVFPTKIKTNQDKRVLMTATAGLESVQHKYGKSALINNSSNPVQCVIDFGSQCTLIKGVGETHIVLMGKTEYICY